MGQNYSNIVEPDAESSYKKLYEAYRDKYREAVKSGGGMPKNYPLVEKSLYNDTISVESGEQIIPLNINNDGFENWTVTINGENASLGTFEGGFPAYIIDTGSSTYGLVDGSAAGGGVLFYSQGDSAADFTVSVIQKQVDENFVQGVKSSIDELDYPYEHNTKIKYDITVTTTIDNPEVSVEEIPASDDLSNDTVYVNDVKLIYNLELGEFVGILNNNVGIEFHKSQDDLHYWFLACNAEGGEPIPGDYTIRVESVDVNLNNRFHDGVDDVLTEYDLATPRVLKYNGTVTITNEDGSPIPFAPGTDTSDYEQWKVYVDNKELLLNNNQFEYTDPDTQIEYHVVKAGNMWGLIVYGSNSGEPVPGTYDVNIYIPGHSNSSSDILVVRISGDENAGYFASMTYSEITGALDNGKTVVAYVESLKRVVPLRGPNLTEGK